MLADFQKIYHQNLMESVIPFWVEHSPDWECGGTYSCLDRDGSVYDTRKYVWMMGRAAWMFARLYNALDRDEKYLQIAKLNLDFIDQHGIDAEGRYYFSFTREGVPNAFQRKIFSAFHHVLACLEYSKATQQSEYFDKALGAFEKIKQWRSDPSLLGRPAFPGLPVVGSLADAMVMSILAYEMAKIEPRQEYLDIMAKALVDACQFCDQERGVFLENVSPEGSAFNDWPDSRLFSPGHSATVAWHLLHLLEFLPDAGMERRVLAMLKGSLERGWDAEFGGLYYTMDLEGKPTLQLDANMKLWWSHAEAIYALCLAHKKTGDPLWLEWLAKVHDYTFSHFVDSEFGGWFGYCDRQGNLIHHAKGGNFKGFYHVPRTLLHASQL